MRKQELKPCPFCGGELQLEKPGTYFSSWRIHCGTDGCVAETGFELGFETKTDAIKAWNLRAK